MDVVLMLPVGLMFFLVKDLMEGNPLDTWGYVWKIAACLVAIAVMEFFKYNKQFTSVYLESGRRRISLAEKLRRLPLSYFGKKDLADLTSTIMADAATIETGTSHWVPELIGSMISTTLIGISLFFFDWRMALAAVWVIPIAISIVLFSSRFQNRFNRRSSQAKVALADSIQEGLEAFQDIRANDAESKYLQGLWPRIDLVEKRAIQAELGVAIFVLSGQMILKLGIATIALVGAILLSAGSLDVLTLFMFLLVASRLYDPMSGSLINLGAAVSLGVQCERMDEILNHPEQRGEESLSNNGYDIEFKDVRFAYDTSETVLDGVSFTAKQGEVTALIGPSGSGKTTISRLASRFWDIPSGTITVGGMDISKIDPETLMSLYSIVFQDVTLFNNTVLENIRIGRKDATDEEVIAAARLAHVDVFAEKLPQGWNTMIGENGSELSGGERQRISIARAFLKDAPIILMDEATASLDVENETFIQESLSRLVKDKTVIIIAHRMRTVAGADKIVVLKEGQVDECGTPAALTASGGFYKRMRDIQQGALEWNI
jgi:ATP-binding cassette subfamily B protein